MSNNQEYESQHVWYDGYREAMKWHFQMRSLLTVSTRNEAACILHVKAAATRSHACSSLQHPHSGTSHHWPIVPCRVLDRSEGRLFPLEVGIGATRHICLLERVAPMAQI